MADSLAPTPDDLRRMLRESVTGCETDRTPPEIAAAMHDCFEGVYTVPLLRRINAPVLLLSGGKSPIASAQQQTFANTLPNGRVEPIVGVGRPDGGA